MFATPAGKQFIGGESNLGFGASASYEFVIHSITKDIVLEHVEVNATSEKYYIEYFASPTYSAGTGNAVAMENMSIGEPAASGFAIERNPTVSAEGSNEVRLVCLGSPGGNQSILASGGLNQKPRVIKAGTDVLVKISNRGAIGDVNVLFLVTELG